MKKRFFLQLFSLICAIFMVACSGDKKSEAAGNGKAAAASKTEYLKVLPSNAYAIAEIDMGNLLNKSDIRNNMVVKKGVEDALQDIPEDVRPLVKSLYDNPNNSGLDITSPIYMAVTSVEPVDVVITLSVCNVNALENILHKLLGPNCVVERDGMKFIDINEDEVQIAYDANKLVIACGQYYANVLPYMNLAAERMAVNDKKFASMFNGDDDAKLALNAEAIMNQLVKEGVISETDIKPAAEMLKDFSLFASLNFEKGYINLRADINTPAEYTNLINQIIKKPTKRHFKYIPANSIAVLNYNFDLTQMFPILESTGALNELSKNGIDAESAKKVLQSISGDYTGAIWVNGDKFSDVQFMFAIDCNDRSMFDMLMAYMTYEFDATVVEEDVYALNVNRKEVYDYYRGEYDHVREGYDYYMMYKDGAIMVMPENLYRNIAINGTLSPLQQNITNNRIFASMNENLVIDAAPVRDIVSNSLKNNARIDDEDKIGLEVLSMIKSLTFNFNILSFDAKLNLNNADANSLKVIVDKVTGFFVMSKILGI